MVSSRETLFGLSGFSLALLLAFGHICLLFVYLSVTQRASRSRHRARPAVLNKTLPVMAFMELRGAHSMTGKVGEIAHLALIRGASGRQGKLMGKMRIRGYLWTHLTCSSHSFTPNPLTEKKNVYILLCPPSVFLMQPSL